MFVTPAYAQAVPSPVDPLGGLLVPMLLMLLIFYFFLIRPQSQRAKQHRDRMNAVRRGDEIEVELADNLKVRIIKSTLMDVRSKGEPVKDAS